MMKIVVTELPVWPCYCFFAELDYSGNGYYCRLTNGSYRCDDVEKCPYLQVLKEKKDGSNE